MKIIKLLLVILLMICSFFAGLKYSELKLSKTQNSVIEEVVSDDEMIYNQNEENVSNSEEENIEDAQIIEDMVNNGEPENVIFDENGAVLNDENLEQQNIQNQQPTNNDQQLANPAQQPAAPAVPNAPVAPAQQPAAPAAPNAPVAPAQQPVAPVATTQAQ